MDLPLSTPFSLGSPESWFRSEPIVAERSESLPNLIQAARRGDESAFTGLVNLYEATAKRVARQILRSEEAAEDAFQDAIIKVHRAMPRFHDGNFRSWLLRIVTNTCYDHLRKEKRRPTVSLEQMLEESFVEMPDPGRHFDPVENALRREQRRVLISTIEELSKWHREVVILVDVHGYDYGEAARMLDVPLGTVKSRLSRARHILRDRLAESDLLETSSIP